MSKFILVHTGNQFPNHINDCIFQLKKYNIEIILIISSKLICNVLDKSIKIEPSEEYEDLDYLQFNLKNHDNSYADGFWTRTSSRFFILKNYAKKHNIKSFFHIESDILIFSNFIEIEKKLNSLNFKCSLVMDSDYKCVPSILWFSDYSILESISNQILLNDHLNDMNNLALLFYNNKDYICNFPIIPERLTSLEVDYSNMYELFDSVFDGAAIGQYLGGIYSDPNLKGYINDTTIFNVAKYDYIWENNEPYMIFQNKKIKINNLHIHSKQLNQFFK